MKTFILIIITMCTNYITAQQSLDTIYANNKKNVALFFPEPIRQGITGTDNFVFTYNREKEQYFGLLQATPGTESNLLAVTKDGQVYSYILKYKEQLKKLNYFISSKASIGNEQPKEIKQKLVKQSQSPYASRTAYFKKFSKYLLNSKSDKLAIKRKKGMKLKLHKMVYDVSEVYLVMEVENYSGINFEIDYINVYRTNGNKKKKASYQKLLIKTVYEHNIPAIVETEKSQSFVLVLPKFVLGEDEKLLLEIKELRGSRKVIFRKAI